MSEKVIKSNRIESALLSQWNVNIYAYEYNDKTLNVSSMTNLDVQDLVAKVGTRRALGIEKEITALATKMNQRNLQLDWLAALLGDLGKAASQFQSDKSNQTASNVSLSDKTFEAMKFLSEGNWYYAESAFWGKTLILKINNSNLSFIMGLSGYSIAQSTYEMLNQLAKSKTDSLNNESQADMTKLQGWVSKRDEGYSTATTLMTNVSESKSNMIKNF